MDNIFDGDELLALARVDIEQNKLENALQKIKLGLQLEKIPTEIYSLGAKIYAQLRLFDKAKEHFSKYLELNPDSVTDRFQLGMVTFDGGDKDGALKVWNELLKDQPTHPPTLYYSSIALLESDDSDGAKRNIDVLLKSAPVTNLYFERGKELLASMSKREQQADKPSIPKDFSYGTEN